MPQTIEVINGLAIFQKYMNDPGYDMGAEHDAIYAYATDKPLSDEDLETVISLGWFQEHADCGDDEFAAKHYDDTESWMCFV